MNRRTLLALAVVGVMLAAACSLAPGADPVVVRTQQFLASTDVGYGIAMDWYFKPGNVAHLNDSQKAAFESLRTGFDPGYKGVQKALDAYKAGRDAGLTTEKARLRGLFVLVQQILDSFAGPALGITPEG